MTETNAALGTLAHALAYENEHVVHKFLDRFDMSWDEAHDLFDEVKKFLWLSTLRGPRLDVTAEMTILDEMWHTFVLFTADYEAFCRAHLGLFAHHRPTTQADEDAQAAARARDPDAFFRARNEAMREEMTFIAEHLGADTLFKWFVEYPIRYGSEFFKHCVKPVELRIDSVLSSALDDIAERYQPEDLEQPAAERAAAGR